MNYSFASQQNKWFYVTFYSQFSLASTIAVLSVQFVLSTLPITRVRCTAESRNRFEAGQCQRLTLSWKLALQLKVVLGATLRRIAIQRALSGERTIFDRCCRSKRIHQIIAALILVEALQHVFTRLWFINLLLLDCVSNVWKVLLTILVSSFLRKQGLLVKNDTGSISFEL